MTDMKFQMILLLSILLLAVFTSLIPHLNYPFPLHVDDWHHIALAKEISKARFLEYYPYTGQPVSGDLEIGYHMLLASIHSITNLGVYMSIFLPPLFAIVSVLAVFTLTRRWGKDVAILSSILTALIPSHQSIGGSVFLAPINLSLIFIPVSLKLAFDSKKLVHYIGLFSICLFLLLSHPPSALVLIGLLSVYSILKFRDNGKSIFLSIFLSILVSFPNYLPYIRSKGMQSITFSFWITLARIPELFGYIPTVFFFVGIYYISRKRDPELWTLLMAIFLMASNILLFVYMKFNTIIPYQRLYIPLLLLMSVISSVGISKLKFKPLVTLIIILIVALSLRQHFSQKYYHIISSEEYQDFIWIRDNTQESILVLIDPWKARAFTPVAERRVLSVMPFGPNQEILEFNEKITKFLEENCTNTNFLKDYNVSLVYSENGCKNNDLVEVRERVYVVT